MTRDFSFAVAHTPDDWARWSGRNVDVTEDGITLVTTPTLAETALGFETVDVDLNPSGDLSVLGPDGELGVYMRAVGELKSLSLSKLEAAGLTRPVAICTTADSLYLIDGENGRVGSFSRQFRTYQWSTAALTAPISAVGDTTRGYVLDGGDGDGASGFVLAVGPGERTDVVVDGLHSPIDLTVDAGGALFVLDRRDDETVLSRYPADDAAENGVATDAEETVLELPETFETTTLTAERDGAIVLGGTDPDGPSVLRYWLADDTAEALPGFERTPTALLSQAMDAGGDANAHRLYAIDGEAAAWALEEGRENRKNDESTRYEGEIVGRLDAGVRELQWHRATFDIDRKTVGTRVDMRYYASDGDEEGIDDFSEFDAVDDETAETLAAAGITGLWELLEATPTELCEAVSDASRETVEHWRERARERIRATFDEREDAVATHDPEDVFLDDAVGRYLHVVVHLVGSRRSSPRVRSLTAYCPRQSYLRYLPEIYREEGSRSEFLEQYLSIFETVFADIETEIDDVTHYLDPDGVPDAYLSWLNTWLAVDIGDAWPESARRELLSRAPELYRMRGTRAGLLEIIELYLRHADRPLEGARSDGETPDVRDLVRIVEYADLECITDRVTRASHARLLGDPQRFQVLIDPSVPPAHVSAIERIVDAEKPAYADAVCEPLRERFQLGENSYLGINTTLPKHRLELGTAALGQESELLE
ncbi:phage tail protein [Natronobiforma cellulositropha]|uniref:phage tail protein n=1 Tax=Natronobiforma cellulositropha TaxID=1679076 RepID=UPI0021D57CC6|nr:phage tail protein [Natronobiforma cellulositropha]